MCVGLYISFYHGGSRFAWGHFSKLQKLASFERSENVQLGE